MFHKIKQGIINLIRWFPVIWQDRQYDGAFLFRILNKKLEIMEHHFKYHTCAAFSKKDIRKITTAKELCKRLSHEDYTPWDENKQEFIKPSPEFDNMITYDEYMAHQDLELLAKIIKTQSRIWWD